MRRLAYTQEIKQSAGRLLALGNKQKLALSSKRLPFLYLLKTGLCSTQEQAGNEMGIHLPLRSSGTNTSSQVCPHCWLSQSGAALQNCTPKPNQPCKQSWPTIPYRAPQTSRCLLPSSGIPISPVAMHPYFHPLGIKNKTGRPTHVRKDGQGEKPFKKKSFPA